MIRRFGLLSLVVGFLVVTSTAHAQYRGNRNAPAMTPYGPVYNPTQTPEWRQAGGNYLVWQEIMMQKMAAKEQAAFQKELAQYQKMLKAQGQQLPSSLNNGQPMFNAPQRRLKKKHSVKPSTTTKSQETTKDAKTATTTAKPVADGEAEATPAATTTEPTRPDTTSTPSAKPAASSK